MKKNYFLIALLFATAAFIVYSCGKSTAYTAPGGGTTPPPTGFATDSISMAGIKFNPAIDTVHVGHAVKWQNNDGVTHTATSDDGSTFNTGNVVAGTSALFTPTTPGTFTYHCIYHQSMGMVGTLIVKP
jgi:plastocyanin